MTSTAPCPTDELAARLAAQRVLPVLRSPSPVQLLNDVTRLISAGFEVIELTTSTPEWATVLEDLAAESAWAHVAFGVGTITSVGDAKCALAAGARFLVSPFPAPDVRSVAGGTPFLEGGYCPGEIAAAARQGIAKLFPARTAGPQHLRSILDVLPTARVVPTGGLDLDDVEPWLRAGALAVGLGGRLTGRSVAELAAARTDWQTIDPSTPHQR